MTAAEPDLRIMLGPKALALAVEGKPIMPNYGEAEALVDALLCCLPAAGLTLVEVN